MKRIGHQEFADLMDLLAVAWGNQDPEIAVGCFTPVGVYMQPPNVQFYTGSEQFRAYFGALEPGTYLRFQNLWFDPERQVGCVEFSFGREGQPTADHGAIVVEVRNGLIAHWREYVQKGPADFAEFVASDGKEWQWHIGNYP